MGIVVFKLDMVSDNCKYYYLCLKKNHFLRGRILYI